MALGLEGVGVEQPCTRLISRKVTPSAAHPKIPGRTRSQPDAAPPWCRRVYDQPQLTAEQCTCPTRRQIMMRTNILPFVNLRAIAGRAKSAETARRGSSQQYKRELAAKTVTVCGFFEGVREPQVHSTQLLCVLKNRRPWQRPWVGRVACRRKRGQSKLFKVRYSWQKHMPMLMVSISIWSAQADTLQLT